jgi:hypothetical protein
MKRLLVASAPLSLCAGAAHAQSTVNKTTFTLVPNAAFLQCLAADGTIPPDAKVVVKRANLNDTLAIHVTGVKVLPFFQDTGVRFSPFSGAAQEAIIM